MVNEERFTYLLERYLANTISASEHDELYAFLSVPAYETLFARAIENDLTTADLDENNADLPPYIAAEIVRNIFESEKHTLKVLPKQKSKLAPIVRWLIAASIITVIVLSSVLIVQHQQSPIAQFRAIIPKTAIENTNKSNKTQEVILSDGSKVTLSPNSSLHYDKTFATDKREVFLEGEAFFQVTKNPSKPFLVYYHNIVTKVLGTSFRINTNETTGNVEVAVSTGRVQVFENMKLAQNKTIAAQTNTIVTPNQKAVFEEANHAFKNGIVDKPLLIQHSDTLKNNLEIINENKLIYNQENLGLVLQQIQSLYGIEIVVESTNLYNCSFTGDISNLDLFSVLKIITISTNSTFEVSGTKILIQGKGCIN